MFVGPVYTVFNPGAWKREEELLYWPDRYICKHDIEFLRLEPFGYPFVVPSTKIEKPDYWKRLRQEHLVKWEESLVPWPFYHIKWSEIRVPWPFQKSEK